MFKLPKIKFVEEFKNEDYDSMISIIAHVLCVMITGFIIMFYIMCKYLYK